MYKQLLYIALSAVLMAGCGTRESSKAEQTEQSTHEGHDHEGHDHEGHNHEGHNHEGHNHEGHDHEGHNHEGHDHEGHDHEGHNHDTESCPSEGQAATSAGKAVVESSDEIIFPKAQAALTDFKVEQIQPAPFSEVLRASGQLLPAQGDQVCVSATVDGIISFGGVKLSDGSRIGQGQSIFYISSKNLATGDASAKSSANYERAKSEFERMEKLLTDRIVSQRDYDAARQTYLQAKAEYESTSSLQSARGTAVVAPMSGYLTSLQIHEGDYVTMGQVLASVSRNRRMELRADVSQKYYPQLKSIRSASFRTPYGDQVLQLDLMKGRLISVGQAAGGHMIPVIFEFDNPGNLVAGSYVEVFLLGQKRQNVISLPLTAITEQQGVHYAYVQLDEEGYMRREVTLGASDGSRVAILSGIKPGERVVTRGAVHVKMAAASGAIPHGHTH